jgi:sulfate adenylyltransferase subunit 1 (EFTu-like GTPase family)
MIKAPEDCVGTYEVPSGYRRIAGDFCSGGIEKGPIVVKCPEKQKANVDKIKVDRDFSLR